MSTIDSPSSQRILASKISFRLQSTPGTPGADQPPPAFEEDSRSSAGAASESTRPANWPAGEADMSDDNGSESSGLEGFTENEETETQPVVGPNADLQITELALEQPAPVEQEDSEPSLNKGSVPQMSQSTEVAEDDGQITQFHDDRVDPSNGYRPTDNSSAHRSRAAAQAAQATDLRLQERSNGDIVNAHAVSDRVRRSPNRGHRQQRSATSSDPEARQSGATSDSATYSVANSPYAERGRRAKGSGAGGFRSQAGRGGMPSSPKAPVLSPGRGRSSHKAAGGRGDPSYAQLAAAESRRTARFGSASGDAAHPRFDDEESGAQFGDTFERDVASSRSGNGDMSQPLLRPEHVVPLMAALTQAEEHSATASIEAQAALRRTENVLVRLAGAVQRAGAALGQALEASGSARSGGGRRASGKAASKQDRVHGLETASAFGSPLSRQELESMCRHLLVERSLDKVALAETVARLMAPPAGSMPLRPALGYEGADRSTAIPGSEQNQDFHESESAAEAKDDDLIPSSGGLQTQPTDSQQWAAVAHGWQRRALAAEEGLAHERRRSGGEAARCRLLEAGADEAIRSHQALSKSIANILAGDTQARPSMLQVESIVSPGIINRRPVPPNEAWGPVDQHTAIRGISTGRPSSVPSGGGRHHARLGGTAAPNDVVHGLVSPRQRRGIASMEQTAPSHMGVGVGSHRQPLAEPTFFPMLTAPGGLPTTGIGYASTTPHGAHQMATTAASSSSAVADARLRQVAANPQHALDTLRSMRTRLQRAAKEINLHAARADAMTVQARDAHLQLGIDTSGRNPQGVHPVEQFAGELGPLLMQKIEAALNRASEARALSAAATGSMLASAGGLVDRIDKKGIVVLARGLGLVSQSAPTKRGKKRGKRNKGRGSTQDVATSEVGYIPNGDEGTASGWLRRALRAATLAADMHGLEPSLERPGALQSPQGEVLDKEGAQEQYAVAGRDLEVERQVEIEERGMQTAPNQGVDRGVDPLIALLSIERGTDPIPNPQRKLRASVEVGEATRASTPPARGKDRSLGPVLGTMHVEVQPSPQGSGQYMPNKVMLSALEAGSLKHSGVEPFAQAATTLVQPKGTAAAVGHSPAQAQSQIADEALAQVSTVPLAVKRVMRLQKGGADGSTVPGARVDLLTLRVFVRLAGNSGAGGLDVGGGFSRASAVPVELRIVGQAVGPAAAARAVSSGGPSTGAATIERARARIEFHAVPLIDPRVGSPGSAGDDAWNDGNSMNSPLLMGVPLDGAVGKAVAQAALQQGLGEHPLERHTVASSGAGTESRGQPMSKEKYSGDGSAAQSRSTTARRRSVHAGLVPGSSHIDTSSNLAAAAAAVRGRTSAMPVAAQKGPPRFGGAAIVVVPQAASLQRRVVAALVRRLLPCLRMNGLGAAERAVLHPRPATEAEGGDAHDAGALRGRLISLNRVPSGSSQGLIPASPVGRVRPASGHPSRRTADTVRTDIPSTPSFQGSTPRRPRPQSAHPRIRNSENGRGTDNGEEVEPASTPKESAAVASASEFTAGGSGATSSSDGDSGSDSDSESGSSSDSEDDGVDETGRGIGEQGALPAAREGEAASAEAVKADVTSGAAGRVSSSDAKAEGEDAPMYPDAVPVGSITPQGLSVLARDRRVISGVAVVLDVLARDSLPDVHAHHVVEKGGKTDGTKLPTVGAMHYQFEARVIAHAPTPQVARPRRLRRRQSLARQTLDAGTVTAASAARPYTARLHIPVDEPLGARRTRLQGALAARMRRLVILESIGEEVPQYLADKQRDEAAERLKDPQKVGAKPVILKRKRGGQAGVDARSSSGAMRMKKTPSAPGGENGMKRVLSEPGTGRPPSAPQRRESPPRAPPKHELLLMRVAEIDGRGFSLRVFEDSEIGGRRVGEVREQQPSSADEWKKEDGEHPKQSKGRERVGLVFEATDEEVDHAVDGGRTGKAEAMKGRPVRVYRGKAIAEVAVKDSKGAMYRVRQRVVDKLSTRLALLATGAKPQGGGKIWLSPIEWGDA